MLRTTIILTILAVTCCIPAWSQEYTFENYTVDNGLPAAQILDVDQLPDGRIIIGTQNGGFSIYDGVQFKSFNEELGLANNIVYDVVGFGDNHIACGTNNGLSIYSHGQFTNYSTDNGLSHNRIYHVLPDGNDLLLSTALGVCRMKKDTIIHEKIDPLLDSVIVFKSMQMKGGDMLYCSGGAGAFIVQPNGSSKRYDMEDGYNFVFDALEMGDTAIWFLCFDRIVSLSNGKKRVVRLEGLTNPAFTGGWIDDRDVIWIATDAGLMRIDENGTQKITTFNGLVNNEIWKIFEDREHNLWFVSRQNGVSKLSHRAFTHYPYYKGVENQPYINASTVQGLMVDSKDRVWIAVENGYSVLDKGVFKLQFVSKAFKDGSLAHIEHFGFSELSTGEIVGASEEGFNRIDPVDLPMGDRVINGDKDMTLYLYCIYEDSDGTIWLGTRGGAAWYKGDAIIGASAIIPTSQSIYAIHKDSKGNLLFATDAGLIEYDGEESKHYRRLEGLVDDRVRCIAEDKDGNVWIGTNEGVYRKNGDQFKAFTIKNKLTANAIFSLLLDDEGYLWAGLAKGVDRIKIKDGEVIGVQHFSASDGFVGKQCMMNAISKDSKGNIWIGTVAGVTKFSPQLYRKNDQSPNLEINSVNLFGQATDWKLFADSVNIDNIPINPDLPYHQNYLSFNFIGITMVASNRVRYKYMLEGLDKGWSASTSKREATYTGLKPGTYTFKVMAANSAGVWTEEPVTFTFTINPPFWQTWWFYGICFIIFVSGVYSYLKIRAANKKILVANEKILNQATIIEEKNKDITDSIEYAKRLQEAFLPSPAEIRKSFADAFVLFKPKDIVSGDFFWFESNGPMRVIVAADCTGHGVPGAMMSMVGNNLLNQIVNDSQVTSPSEALNQLDVKLQQALQKSEGGAQDGMDIAMCAFNTENGVLDYSGANNPLYVIRSNDNPLMVNGEAAIPRMTEGNMHFYEVKATRQPIGAYADKMPFELNTIKVEKGDAFYIFSDGYADQFGGPRGKKFRYKQFRELLLEYFDKPMDEQLSILNEKFVQWQGGMEQVDDICVIGVKA